MTRSRTRVGIYVLVGALLAAAPWCCGTLHSAVSRDHAALVARVDESGRPTDLTGVANAALAAEGTQALHVRAHARFILGVWIAGRLRDRYDPEPRRSSIERDSEAFRDRPLSRLVIRFAGLHDDGLDLVRQIDQVLLAEVGVPDGKEAAHAWFVEQFGVLPKEWSLSNGSGSSLDSAERRDYEHALSNFERSNSGAIVSGRPCVY